MAVKNGVLKKHNGTDYDQINLKTTAGQVELSDGTTVQDFVDNLPTGSGGSSAVVVADIDARDALTVTAASGQIVYVKDATGDSTVNTNGATYIFDGTDWIKISEFESLDTVLNWTDIQGKPNVVDIQVSATQPTGQKAGDFWIQEV